MNRNSERDKINEAAVKATPEYLAVQAMPPKDSSRFIAVLLILAAVVACYMLFPDALLAEVALGAVLCIVIVIAMTRRT